MDKRYVLKEAERLYDSLIVYKDEKWEDQPNSIALVPTLVTNCDWTNTEKPDTSVFDELKKHGYHYYKVYCYDDDIMLNYEKEGYSCEEIGLFDKHEDLPGMWFTCEEAKKLLLRNLIDKINGYEDSQYIIFASKDVHIRTCLISLAKNEEEFIEEWVDWHNRLGVDEIFICDNNPRDSRLVLDLNKYKNVSVVPVNHWNFGEMTRMWALEQKDIFQFWYKYILKVGKFDYVCFLDLDEFLDFKGNYDTLEDFVKNELFLKDERVVSLKWETYDDNDLVYEDETGPSVVETYTRLQTKYGDEYKLFTSEAGLNKVIMRVYPEFEFRWCPHMPAAGTCSGDVVVTKFLPPTFAVVRHYRTKCLETFVKHKCLHCRVNAHPKFTKVFVGYFRLNYITQKKIDAIPILARKYGIQYNRWDMEQFQWILDHTKTDEEQSKMFKEVFDIH